MNEWLDYCWFHNCCWNYHCWLATQIRVWRQNWARWYCLWDNLFDWRWIGKRRNQRWRLKCACFFDCIVLHDLSLWVTICVAIIIIIIYYYYLFIYYFLLLFFVVLWTQIDDSFDFFIFVKSSVKMAKDRWGKDRLWLKLLPSQLIVMILAIAVSYGGDLNKKYKLRYFRWMVLVVQPQLNFFIA